MNRTFYHSGEDSELPYGKNYKKKSLTNEISIKKNLRKDDDLIIEDNTIYEIDRDCYERLRRQKRKK
ncbi:MAG: hypothetical protein GX359_04740 [Clostridiales bacterium]|nr:hypothetical protein [Clostridiales bacterium]